MRVKRKYSWEEPFYDAISNATSPDLVCKITIARTAIDARISELLSSRGGNAERQAVIDALFSLQILEMCNRLTERDRDKSAA